MIKMNGRRLLGALVAATLLLAACGSDPAVRDAAGSGTTEAAAAPIDESTMLASLEGTPHMLWFWAPN